MKIKTQNIPELIAKLSKRGARPFSVTLATPVTLLKKDRKTGKPSEFPPLTKVSRISAFLNFNYENSVNLQRNREGIAPDFKSVPNWFTHTDIPAVVRGKNGLYLQLKIQKISSVSFIDRTGREYDRDALRGYLPVPSKKTRQGVEKSVLTMVPRLDSIVEFNVDKEKFEVDREKIEVVGGYDSSISNPAAIPSREALAW